MVEHAFHGLKVLEYCNLVSGPYCGKLLADMGAEVIKIEVPGLGDKARRKGPFLGNIPHTEKSGLFLYLNTNKMSITLNPKTQTGKKIFESLVKETDILIENNPPQMMKDLGLDYESLKEINSSMIMTSITPFGQTGPHKDYKAHNINMYFGSGLAYQPQTQNKGKKPEGPVKAGRFLGDYACGLTAAVATLGALFARGKTGLGQHVDISEQEALIALQRVTAVIYPNQGISEFSLSNLSRAMGGLMQCKDGYVITTNAEEHQWEAFVKLLGEPEWIKDPKLKNTFSRAMNYHKIEPLVSEWMMNHTKEELYHRGQELSCPIAMVNSTDEIVNSEQMKARDFFVEIDHSEAGRLKYPQAPYRFSKTPWMINRPAPKLGEYNEEVYCKRLGYSEEDLVRFAEVGII